MTCRLMLVRGQFRFVFFVGDEGCAIADNRGAWRRSIYRLPTEASGS